MHNSSSFLNITLHVLDGLSVHHQESKIVHTAVNEPVWHITDAVCTVLDSWWWMERSFETCRVIFNKLEKLCI